MSSDSEDYVDDIIKLDFEQKGVKNCCNTPENKDMSGMPQDITPFHNTCKPVTVKVVDVQKFPWYYKKYQVSICRNKITDVEDDGDIIVLDAHEDFCTPQVSEPTLKESRAVNKVNNFPLQCKYLEYNEAISENKRESLKNKDSAPIAAVCEIKKSYSEYKYSKTMDKKEIVHIAEEISVTKPKIRPVNMENYKLGFMKLKAGLHSSSLPDSRQGSASHTLKIDFKKNIGLIGMKIVDKTKTILKPPKTSACKINDSIKKSGRVLTDKNQQLGIGIQNDKTPAAAPVKITNTSDTKDISKKRERYILKPMDCKTKQSDSEDMNKKISEPHHHKKKSKGKSTKAKSILLKELFSTSDEDDELINTNLKERKKHDTKTKIDKTKKIKPKDSSSSNRTLFELEVLPKKPIEVTKYPEKNSNKKSFHKNTKKIRVGDENDAHSKGISKNEEVSKTCLSVFVNKKIDDMFVKQLVSDQILDKIDVDSVIPDRKTDMKESKIFNTEINLKSSDEKNMMDTKATTVDTEHCADSVPNREKVLNPVDLVQKIPIQAHIIIKYVDIPEPLIGPKHSNHVSQNDSHGPQQGLPNLVSASEILSHPILSSPVISDASYFTNNNSRKTSQEYDSIKTADAALIPSPPENCDNIFTVDIIMNPHTNQTEKSSSSLMTNSTTKDQQFIRENSPIQIKSSSKNQLQNNVSAHNNFGSFNHQPEINKYRNKLLQVNEDGQIQCGNNKTLPILLTKSITETRRQNSHIKSESSSFNQLQNSVSAYNNFGLINHQPEINKQRNNLLQVSEDGPIQCSNNKTPPIILTKSITETQRENSHIKSESSSCNQLQNSVSAYNNFGLINHQPEINKQRNNLLQVSEDGPIQCSNNKTPPIILTKSITETQRENSHIKSDSSTNNQLQNNVSAYNNFGLINYRPKVNEHRYDLQQANEYEPTQRGRNNTPQLMTKSITSAQHLIRENSPIQSGSGSNNQLQNNVSAHNNLGLINRRPEINDHRNYLQQAYEDVATKRGRNDWPHFGLLPQSHVNLTQDNQMRQSNNACNSFNYGPPPYTKTFMQQNTIPHNSMSMQQKPPYPAISGYTPVSRFSAHMPPNMSMPENSSSMPQNLTYMPQTSTFMPHNSTSMPHNSTFTPRNMPMPLNPAYMSENTSMPQYSTNMTRNRLMPQYSETIYRQSVYTEPRFSTSCSSRNNYRPNRPMAMPSSTSTHISNLQTVLSNMPINAPPNGPRHMQPNLAAAMSSNATILSRMLSSNRLPNTPMYERDNMSTNSKMPASSSSQMVNSSTRYTHANVNDKVSRYLPKANWSSIPETHLIHCAPLYDKPPQNCPAGASQSGILENAPWAIKKRGLQDITNNVMPPLPPPPLPPLLPPPPPPPPTLFLPPSSSTEIHPFTNVASPNLPTQEMEPTTIIGTNNDGLVRKILLAKQPQSSPKSLSPRNQLATKTAANPTSSSPILSKSKMLEELSIVTYLDDNEISPTRPQTKGYSPPILPISSHQKTLSSKMKCRVSCTTIMEKEYSDRLETMQTVTAYSPQNENSRHIEKTTEVSPMKKRKLSNEESDLHQCNSYVSIKDEPKVKVEIKSECGSPRQYEIRQSTESDLGYDSDSTVKL